MARFERFYDGNQPTISEVFDREHRGVRLGYKVGRISTTLYKSWTFSDAILKVSDIFSLGTNLNNVNPKSDIPASVFLVSPWFGSVTIII